MRPAAIVGGVALVGIVGWLLLSGGKKPKAVKAAEKPAALLPARTGAP
jgi:hypothetical protein